MAAVLSPLCALDSSCLPKNRHTFHRRFVQGGVNIFLDLHYKGSRSKASHFYIHGKTPKFHVLAATEGSAKSSESEETLPSWARPDSDEPPPWARDEDKQSEVKDGFEVPFYVYLLASAVTAIAAVSELLLCQLSAVHLSLPKVFCKIVNSGYTCRLAQYLSTQIRNLFLES